MLSEYEWQVTPQSAFGISEADETGLTFVENAILKARHAAARSKCITIADDSGLAVDALDGAPGVRSARFAGSGASDRANIDRLLQRLTDVPDPLRTARFHCVMVLLRHPEDPCPLIGQGAWDGVILRSPIGDSGFGYDPVFFLPDRGCTAAQLQPGEKNFLSHRGQALRALVEKIRNSHWSDLRSHVESNTGTPKI